MLLQEFIKENEHKVYNFGGFEKPWDYVIKHPEEVDEVKILFTFYNTPVYPVFFDGSNYNVVTSVPEHFDDEEGKVGYVILSHLWYAN